MSKAYRLMMAKQKGEALIRELGISALAVDPFEIAARHDITVESKADADSGVSGMLLRHGNTFGILYATHINNEGFQRFSVAHELGHYFLDGHVDHVLPNDGIHASYAGYSSIDSYELEADHFATGLLMPRSLFSQALGKHDAGLEAIESLSELCRTSLTATAIRYSELTNDAVAVVMSTGVSVDFCFFSNTMKSLREITWLRKGSAVPRNTITAQIGANSNRVLQGDRADAAIDITDWFGGIRRVPAVEEVIGLGAYGKTLTVLTCPSLVDDTYVDSDDDEEDEQDMIERWTPRFHR